MASDTAIEAQGSSSSSAAAFNLDEENSKSKAKPSVDQLEPPTNDELTDPLELDCRMLNVTSESAQIGCAGSLNRRGPHQFGLQLYELPDSPDSVEASSGPKLVESFTSGHLDEPIFSIVNLRPTRAGYELHIRELDTPTQAGLSGPRHSQPIRFHTLEPNNSAASQTRAKSNRSIAVEPLAGYSANQPSGLLSALINTRSTNGRLLTINDGWRQQQPMASSSSSSSSSSQSNNINNSNYNQQNHTKLAALHIGLSSMVDFIKSLWSWLSGNAVPRGQKAPTTESGFLSAATGKGNARRVAPSDAQSPLKSPLLLFTCLSVLVSLAGIFGYIRSHCSKPRSTVKRQRNLSDASLSEKKLYGSSLNGITGAASSTTATTTTATNERETPLTGSSIVNGATAPSGSCSQSSRVSGPTSGLVLSSSSTPLNQFENGFERRSNRKPEISSGTLDARYLSLASSRRLQNGALLLAADHSSGCSGGGSGCGSSMRPLSQSHSSHSFGSELALMTHNNGYNKGDKLARQSRLRHGEHEKRDHERLQLAQPNDNLITCIDRPLISNANLPESRANKQAEQSSASGTGLLLTTEAPSRCQVATPSDLHDNQMRPTSLATRCLSPRELLDAHGLAPASKATGSANLAATQEAYNHSTSYLILEPDDRASCSIDSDCRERYQHQYNHFAQSISHNNKRLQFESNIERASKQRILWPQHLQSMPKSLTPDQETYFITGQQRQTNQLLMVESQEAHHHRSTAAQIHLLPTATVDAANWSKAFVDCADLSPDCRQPISANLTAGDISHCVAWSDEPSTETQQPCHQLELDPMIGFIQFIPSPSRPNTDPNGQSSTSADGSGHQHPSEHLSSNYHQQQLNQSAKLAPFGASLTSSYSSTSAKDQVISSPLSLTNTTISIGSDQASTMPYTSQDPVNAKFELSATEKSLV